MEDYTEKRDIIITFILSFVLIAILMVSAFIFVDSSKQMFAQQDEYRSNAIQLVSEIKKNPDSVMEIGVGTDGYVSTMNKKYDIDIDKTNGTYYFETNDAKYSFKKDANATQVSIALNENTDNLRQNDYTITAPSSVFKSSGNDVDDSTDNTSLRVLLIMLPALMSMCFIFAGRKKG